MDKPDFDIPLLIIMAHKATDGITSSRMTSPSHKPSWGSVKAASAVMKMISEQLDMHANKIKKESPHEP